MVPVGVSIALITQRSKVQILFAVQDMIAAAIADVLRAKLSPETAAPRRYVPNLRAYEAYLKARDLWFRGTRPELLAAF